MVSASNNECAAITVWFDAFCMCSTVAEVGTDQTSYTVPEDVGQLEVWINITSGQKAPGQECEIEVVTTNGSAVGELIVTVCTVSSPVNDCDVL